MALKYELEMELKSPADAVWCLIRDSNFLFPKIMPEIYESIEILEGDGRSAGTLRLATYAKESGMACSFKSKLESIDEEKKTVHYCLIEGTLLEYYKFFDDIITVEAKPEGCVVHWCCLYEKTSPDVIDIDVMSDTMIGMYQKLDAYLLGKNEN